MRNTYTKNKHAFLLKPFSFALYPATALMVVFRTSLLLSDGYFLIVITLKKYRT